MKLYEQYPGLLYSRGKIRDSHVPELIDGGYTVIQLAPPTPNEKIRDALGPMRYIHLPVPDGVLDEKARRRFMLAADVALARVQSGSPVIVHCNAGRNRAGLLSALVLRQLLNVSGEEAMAMVRSVRPRAIANPRFEKWLKSLGKPNVGVMIV